MAPTSKPREKELPSLSMRYPDSVAEAKQIEPKSEGRFSRGQSHDLAFELLGELFSDLTFDGLPPAVCIVAMAIVIVWAVLKRATF
jgi:hypothetical protein